jgi:hypothetical protein
VGDQRAGTAALTRRQQASRAFAAEMVAPQEVLRDLADKKGFSGDQIEEQAGKLIAPFDAVLWQALRAGVELYDVELPVQGAQGLFSRARAS